MRISDWSSDVCSSDLNLGISQGGHENAPPAICHQGGDHGFAQVNADKGQHTLLQRHAEVTQNKAEPRHTARDRKSVVKGKSVSVRVDLGGSRLIKKKKNTTV